MSEKIVLITGASDGIGAVTARLAARKGYTVCINFRQNEAGAERVVADIRAAGGKAGAYQADISQEAEVMRLFENIDRDWGRLYALVNNAAIIESQQRLCDMSAQRLYQNFSVNVIGSFLCAREAVRRMSTRFGGTGGSIVNLSSIAAKLGAPFEYIDYAAAKGAIDTMTVGLAKEVAAEQIRVNAVRPGIIYTDIHGKAGDPGRVDRLKSSIPMQRGGYPEEIAHSILWLLSEEASYVSGALLDVAGGR